MHNKLQYTWRGYYFQCVRSTQLPVLTRISSSVPPGTTSTIRSPSGPHRIQLLHSSKWYEGAIRNVCIHLILVERPSFFIFVTRQVSFSFFFLLLPVCPYFSPLSLSLFVYTSFFSLFHFSFFLPLHFLFRCLYFLSFSVYIFLFQITLLSSLIFLFFSVYSCKFPFLLYISVPATFYWHPQFHISHSVT